MIKIGIISDNPSAILAGILEQAGYVAVHFPTDQLPPQSDEDIAAWVLDCTDPDPVAEIVAELEPLLVLSNRPAHAATAPYREWCQRVLRQLDKWCADLWQESTDSDTTPEGFAELAGCWQAPPAPQRL